MKILWVSNSPIGPAAAVLGEEYKGSSGGWIQTEYETLDKTENQMVFLSTLSSVKKGHVLHKKNEQGEIYCVNAPRLSYGISTPNVLQNNIQEIIDAVNPDVIQIWGTETWLSNAVAKCKTNASKIIFVQGLMGVHKRYLGGYFGHSKDDRKYLCGESFVCRLKSTLRKRCFIKQAEIEKETIAKCKNVIVDSDFARSYCSSVASDVVCYQHVLLPNDLFYKKRWSSEQCNRYSIFTVYGSSAEKGTQNLLKAVAIIKKRFPNVKVIIPGAYKLDANGKLLPSKSDAFQNVLYNMISNLHLNENVMFTGRLNASQMAETMKKCHAFVNPSCMEVHALSLREAMIEGVPCVSSLCGSVGEVVRNGQNGCLYRYEEYETLAYYLERIFSDDIFAQKLADNAPRALDDIKKNSKTLDDIYRELLLV